MSSEQKTVKTMAEIMSRPFEELDSKEVETAISYIAKIGKGIVAPRRLTIAKLEKMKGETKTENWMMYERAYYADPTLFRAVNVIAFLCISYGYYFGYPFVNKKISKKDENALELITEWSNYVNLPRVFVAIIIDLIVFGNAFVEKIYDSEPLGENGWGIEELKILHPTTMYIERGETGDVIAYWQRTSSLAHTAGTTLETLTFKPTSKDIKIYPEHMIHIDWNNFTNSTYGISSMMPLIDTLNMKLGMKEDLAFLVQRWAEPFIAWLVGNEAYQSVSTNHLNLVKTILATQADDKNVALPWYVKPEPITVGNEAMDISVYLDFTNAELLKGVGVPDLLLGQSGGAGGSSRETSAEMRMESFVRFLKTLQTHLTNIFRRRCLPDLIYYPTPDKKAVDKAGRYRAKGNLKIKPKRWKKIPTIKWRVIEKVSDMRLRLEALVNAGIIEVEESREELLYPRGYDEEKLNPANRDKLASAEDRKASAERMREETKNPKKFQAPAASPFGAKPPQAGKKDGAKPSGTAKKDSKPTGSVKK